MIITVNEAWRRHSRNNGGSAELANPIGVNYLQMCNLPGRECGHTNSAQLLAGIRAVLEGRQSEFSMEYPSYSPDQTCWFYVHVTRMQGLRPGVIVIHQDVTDRKIAELLWKKAAANLCWWPTMPQGRSLESTEIFVTGSPTIAINTSLEDPTGR